MRRRAGSTADLLTSLLTNSKTNHRLLQTIVAAINEDEENILVIGDWLLSQGIDDPEQDLSYEIQDLLIRLIKDVLTGQLK